MERHEALITIRATDAHTANTIRDAVETAVREALPDLNAYVGTDPNGQPLQPDTDLPYVLVVSARTT